MDYNQAINLAAGTQNVSVTGTMTAYFDNDELLADFNSGRRSKKKGRKRAGSRTKSTEELYGAAEKAGLCTIIRKKGKPPVIKWHI